ncbi:MAG: UvrD-helicase domain-containing protein [Alistipes sp.]|nr:UvrD-helicase domain-containing protein [Alistipes sp.]
MGVTKASNRVVIVPASAGSGKTFRIAHEFLYDVLRNRLDGEGVPYFDHNFYRRILAVTFTNKATEEMKSRILVEIHKLASGDKSAHLADLISETALAEEELRRRAEIVRQAILHDYSHFTVLTNDTFFQRILRAFLRELGIDMNFTIELDTAPVFARSIDALIEKIKSNSELRDWIEGLIEERMRDGEKWNIRYSIALFNKELFKEATRDIVGKMPDKGELKEKVDAYVEIATQRINAFKKEAQRAVDMIQASPYVHKTFSNGFTVVFEAWADGNIKTLPPSYAKHTNDDVRKWFAATTKPTEDMLALAAALQPILADLNEQQPEMLMFSNTKSLLLKNYRYIALLRDLQECVQEVCGEENSFLLNETKHLISNFISEDEAPFIYEKVGGWFEKFMIDEFQDTSAKEWRNFLPLLRNAMANSDETSVLIVGDVKQSIYRWRGGDWRILGTQAERDLGEGYRDPLKQNWRSLPNIVKFNNMAFSNIVKDNAERLDAELRDALEQGRITQGCFDELNGSLSQAYANNEQEIAISSKHEGYISFTYYVPSEVDNLKTEYINDIRRLLDKGFKPCDITILVRTNKQAAWIAEQLLLARNSFPELQRFEITTEEALSLTSSPAVQFVIAVLRLAINRKDKESLAIYNSFIGRTPLYSSPEGEEQKFFDGIRMMSPEDAFEHIMMRYAKLFVGDGAYLQALHENIVNFSANRVSDIGLFERWWRDKGSSLSLHVERSENAIEVMTIHKAKGLENKVIIVPLCSWDISPSYDGAQKNNRIWVKAAGDRNLSDIGHLSIGMNTVVGQSLFADGYFREKIYAYIDGVNELYVALTRAKEQLYIYSPKGRAPHIGNVLATAIGAKPEASNTDILRYEKGEITGPEPQKASEQDDKERVIPVRLGDCEASPLGVKLRTNASRYFADERGALSPRSTGIRLHRIFEESVSREDLFAKLDEMVKNGDIAVAERDGLCEKIDYALDNTLAGEWFNGCWERVYNERTILTSDNDVKRPDRVMMRGKEAVVVDYKFGEEHHNHKRQIATYMERLRNMGYTTVNGYVWYVPTGVIVEVEP